MTVYMMANSNPLFRRQIAFTTPQTYAERISRLLQIHQSEPLWIPTIVIEPTDQTKSSLSHFLTRQPKPNSDSLLEQKHFSAIAFTSRNGISAFSEILSELKQPPLSSTGDIFTVSALGRDAELLDEVFLSKLCENPDRVRVLIPQISTPSGLIEALGLGFSKRILCPVPVVVDLEEPPVVPEFVKGLAAQGWIPIRIPAYETRWLGKNCAERLVLINGVLDAIIFTSTAEVDGLLKSLKELGFDWEKVKARWPEMVVAAHGPVTAMGAERLGISVDVVSSKFHSFEGVIEAIAERWKIP